MSAAKSCASCAWYVAEGQGKGRCYSTSAKIVVGVFTFMGPPAPVHAYGREREASDGVRCRWHELPKGEP